MGSSLSPPATGQNRHLWLHVGAWVVAIALVVWILARVPLFDIWDVIRHLTLIQISAVLAVNVLVIMAFSGRWWVLLSAMGHDIPYLSLTLNRLAGFGVSYFTPGPQVGGEPVQALLLRRSHDLPLDTAAASIGLDRLIEISVNLAFLFFGVSVLLERNLFSAALRPGALVLLAGFITLPVVYLGLLIVGQTPLAWLVSQPARRMKSVAFLEDAHRAVWQVEDRARAIFREHPGSVLSALAISLISWVGLIFEYWLLVRFIGINLTPLQLIVLLTATRIAFLAPLPSGLGILEASQVVAFQAVGLDPAAGLSASLIMRGRDILFGLVGLWWMRVEWGKQSNPVMPDPGSVTDPNLEIG